MKAVSRIGFAGTEESAIWSILRKEVDLLIALWPGILIWRQRIRIEL